MHTPSRKIAIVGCGYVGGALGSALVRLGHDVVATTTTAARADELRALGLTPIVVRLQDVSQLHAALADRDDVFLMVAPKRGEQTYRDVYLDGIRYLVDALRGTSVGRIVYTSSTSVYGQSDGSWVDEDSPTEPLSDSGRMILASERALHDGAESLGVGVTILRLAGIHGPGRGPVNVVPRYAGQERDDGEAYVNLIHRDDIVDACVKLLDVAYDGVLNLCDGEPVLRRAYYDRLIAAADGQPIHWRRSATPIDRGKRVSNRRIRELLGLPSSQRTSDA